MTSEVQTLILDTGRASGLLTPDVVDSCRAVRRDRAAASASPLLKLLLERQGLSKADLDRLLERFWAASGGRRAQLHRMVEERIVATYVVEASLAPESKVAIAEQEFEQRVTGGDMVRLLSILVDTGTIDENAARQTVTEVQKVWRFCKYCLSTFKIGAGAAPDACAICGRPLTVAARAYEIVKLSTIAEHDGKGGPRPAKPDAPPVAKLPEKGETLAGVKLLEKVDEAGRGAVYKGQRAGDGALRAVKVWRLGKDLTAEDVHRFESAALSATKLKDPGILEVFEAGEEAGRHFVVSEWVVGKTLRKLVEEKGPLAPDRAAQVLIAALKALESAHKQKLLHKNVTPGNVFVVEPAGQPLGVKIGEFGVCKDYGVSLETVRGNVIGSPDYLAPEQCQGTKSDERTDLFSLGATLYYALAAKKPFEGDSTVTLVVKRLTTDAKPLREVAPKVPKELAAIIAKLMARKPDDRYKNAREAWQAVEQWRVRAAAGLEGIEEPTKAKTLAKTAGAVAALAAVAAVVVLGFLHFSGPGEGYRAAVKDGRELAERGLLVESIEKLAPLVKEEGRSGEAARALEEATAKTLTKANELAAAKDYPGAVALIERAKPSLAGLGVSGESALADGEHALETKRAEYEKDAKDAYDALIQATEKAKLDDALKLVREYRAKFPRQKFDDAAKVSEEKLAARQRQLALFDEAESKAAAGDAEAARARLADAVALREIDPELEPRKKKIENLTLFAQHMADGDKLSAAGEVERAVAEYNAAAEIYPDRAEVRRAIAKAHRDDKLREAEREAAEQNWPKARELFREADLLCAQAGLDSTEIRERVKQIDASLKAQREQEKEGQEDVASGDKAAESGDWAAALTYYLKAEKLLRQAPLVEDRLDTARARASGAIEDGEWKDLQAAVDRVSSPAGKVELLQGFVERYPAGQYAAEARERIEKLRMENKLAAPTVHEKPRAQPLRLGERRGNPAVQEYVNPADGSAMVLVPAGLFKRGTTSAQARALADAWGIDARRFQDEQPQRELTLSAFYMDVQKVTNADYAIFLAAIAAEKDPHRWCRAGEPDDKKAAGHEPKYWSAADSEHWSRSELPVVGVDWWDAAAYASWAGKRLPTEAEWEKAARGTDGRTYPWGDDTSPFYACTAEAWMGHAFRSLGDWKQEMNERKPWVEKGLTVAMTAFPLDRSPFGCMHLGGNVWEWCEDWYHPDAYTALPDRDPVAREPVKEKPERVVRGGSWYTPLVECRAAYRGHRLAADARNFTTGFRCARTADGK